MTSICFLINGISSLLGWNCVLAAFDYFDKVYEGRSVTIYFTIPVFAGYVLVGVLFNRLHKASTYKTLIMLGIILTNVAIIGMLVISLVAK